MQKLEYNGLYVDNNTISVSTTPFYIGLMVNAVENDIVVKMKIGYSDDKLTFYSIEEAMAFVKTILEKKFETEDEVFSFYYQKKEQGEIAQKININKTNGAFLSIDNIYSAISGCYGRDKNYKVSATSEQYDSIDGDKIITFYLVEHLDYDGIKKENPICLSEHDLKQAIEYYLSETNIAFVGFKDQFPFKVAYREANNGVSYEGLEIITAEKEKNTGIPLQKLKTRQRKSQV